MVEVQPVVLWHKRSRERTERRFLLALAPYVKGPRSYWASSVATPARSLKWEGPKEPAAAWRYWKSGSDSDPERALSARHCEHCGLDRPCGRLPELPPA